MRNRPAVNPVVRVQPGPAPVLAGVLLGLTIILLGAVFLTVVLQFTPVSERALPILAAILAVGGVFCAGARAGRRAGVVGWLHGLAAGVFLVVVVSLFGLLVGGLSGSVSTFGLKVLYGALVGTAGGVFGVNL